MSEMDQSINAKNTHLQISASCVKLVLLINSLNSQKAKFVF